MTIGTGQASEKSWRLGVERAFGMTINDVNNDIAADMIYASRLNDICLYCIVANQQMQRMKQDEMHGASRKKGRRNDFDS